MAHRHDQRNTGDTKMLIPIVMPSQTPLWKVYLIARALEARLVARGYRLYLEVRP